MKDSLIFGIAALAVGVVVMSIGGKKEKSAYKRYSTPYLPYGRR